MPESSQKAEIKPNKERKPILKALMGETLSSPPFWFMRQAGRYLPEYREIRSKADGFLDMVYNPYTASEVTLQPLRRYGMDAAVIFSDILVIPQALGQKLEFVEGEGPKLQPVRSALDLLGIGKILAKDKLKPVYDALTLTSQKLRQEGFLDTALIGFSGAPWTLACYMVEGQGSKTFQSVLDFLHEDSESFSQLITILTQAVSDHCIEQVRAGAEVLQIFDSWAGYLDGEDFDQWVTQPTIQIVKNIREIYPDIPLIGFPKGAGPNYLPYAQKTNLDAISLDYNVPVEWAADVLQKNWVVQGNLNPVVLKEGDELEKEAHSILRGLSGGPFIFNLGHGIDKDTPIPHVERLVKLIREYHYG